MSPLSDSQIAIALVESKDLRPTKANVMLVKEAIESKVFLPISSLVSLRESARNITIPGKVDYILFDGTTVALDVETNILINNIIEQNQLHHEALEMAQSSEKFLCVARRLIKEHHGN
jgi:hypothetical protein